MTMATETPTKTCIRCEKEKPEDAFPKNSLYGGTKATCRQCFSDQRKGNDGGGGPATYINPDAKKETTRHERHRIAGEGPLTAEEVRAVEQATENMLNHESVRHGLRQPEPMAPIDELLKEGKITEPRRWYLCDRALQGLEKRKAG